MNILQVDGSDPGGDYEHASELVAQVRAVPLAGVDPKSVSEESRRDLELAAVYVALMKMRGADAMRDGKPAV